MRFLAPGWILVGVAAALALVALHLLALGRPAPLLLPTARFVPMRSARARRLARRPRDLLLLAMRAAAVLTGALALARPTRTPERRPIARVIVADRSGAVRDVGAVRDSVRAVGSTGDLLVAFDTAARAAIALGTTPAARDSAIDRALARDSASSAPAGSLSAALAAARRAAPRLRDGADSVELVIVAPLTTREADAATGAVRATWAGRARVMRVAAAEPPAAGAVRVTWRRGGSDDALAAAAGMLDGTVPSPQGGSPPTPNIAPDARERRTDPTPGGSAERTTALVVRDGATAADSAWARANAGALVDWPADGVPNGWRPRARVDTAGAVVAGTAAFVAPIARRAAWPGSDAAARVIARWADGEPAAVERALGDGCVRGVAVPVPQVGDAALRPPFRALLAALTAPCAHRATGAPLGDATVRALAGSGRLLATDALGRAPTPPDPLAQWLLAAAIALLVIELPLRLARRPVEPPNDIAADASTEAAA
ncbi:hypothetical protein J421_0523 [Gemmatirosa kalamazoonensis]|uniref:Aerotolerance regulator N-terminal domain-containing protein n=1 Tax=Gemmatirosa kalamazoonensis TaxID=861299 RepID=W0RCL3_9BACT|nr:hypothetical protein [Gemmatirosa kalamazoonensis]AHG88060.1 hypothetical protein J421_0523 [Gemmatirosa kalamazoonensis]